MSRLTALITNASSDSGVAAAFSLKRAAFDVIGVDSQRMPFDLHSRYFNHYIYLPYRSMMAFPDCMTDILRRFRPALFFPIGTDAVRFAVGSAQVCRENSHLLIPPEAAFKAALDKRICNTECRTLGIPSPEMYTESEARDILKSGTGHLVVKPALDFGAAKGVCYPPSADVLETAVRHCAARYGDVIIQEYIPGPADAMHTVVLLYDSESRLAAAFTTRKIRQWPPTGGVTAVSRSSADHHLIEQVHPFFRKWRWRGFAEVELKCDSRDGTYSVIEINPRCMAYLRFPILCGLDLPKIYAALAMGGKANPSLHFPRYRVGEKYVNPGLFLRNVAADLSHIDTHFLAVRRAVRDLAGTGPVLRSFARDPLPLMGRVLQDLRG